MSSLVNRIIARLYAGGVNFSRNRNYQTYEDPKVRRAARIYRHLKSLEADLVAFGAPDTVEVVETARASDGHTCVRLTIESMDCRRTAYLSRFELDLLRRNPSVRPLLVTSRT